MNWPPPKLNKGRQIGIKNGRIRAYLKIESSPSIRIRWLDSVIALTSSLPKGATLILFASSGGGELVDSGISGFSAALMKAFAFDEFASDSPVIAFLLRLLAAF